MRKQRDIETGRFLVAEGLISEETLSRALEIQQEFPEKRLGEILVEMGIPEEVVLQGLSKKLNIEYVERVSFPETPPVELSLEFMKNNLVIPLSLEDGTLSVAMADPENIEIIERVRTIKERLEEK